MLQKWFVFLLAAVVFTLLTAHGQAQQVPGGGRGQVPGRGQASPPPQGREDALDPTPINTAVDPDVDMFLSDWRNSKPRTMYGQLVFRDILTKLEGPDPLHPTKKGAVLQILTAISYAMLQPGAVASGRVLSGERQTFYTSAGSGEITVDSKSYDIKEGSGFALQPGFEFKLTSRGKEPLAFYVRTDSAAPGNTPSDNPRPGNMPTQAFNVTNRLDADRRIGIHWAHIPSGGLITIAPHTIPQPHSHYNEEIWIMVKGETVLSLGKNLRRMVPGQAFKIPPTGVTAHSNINMGEEPVQMMVVIPSGRASEFDYAQLEGSAFNPATAPDVDMFMGNWREAFPRIMHGNLYFRDMLTALQGPDSLHPVRKGAVLVNSEAVSYAMLEPGSTAHKIDGQLKGIQQTFVVNSGTGSITSGGRTVELSKDMSFILTPGLEFSLKATGDQYMTFYVVSEKLPEGSTPKATLQVVDHRAAPQVANAWVNKERPIITNADGLSQYKALTRAEMGPMTMSRAYSVAQGGEEIWIATEGDIDMLFGKQLRKLPAGTAYLVPSTGLTPHAKINLSGKTARFIYMVK